MRPIVQGGGGGGYISYIIQLNFNRILQICPSIVPLTKSCPIIIVQVRCPMEYLYCPTRPQPSSNPAGAEWAYTLMVSLFVR